MKKVYLAGPITGLDFENCIGWREEAKVFLNDNGIAAYSPLRCKDYLRGKGILTATGAHTNPLSTDRGIFTRDKHDVITCDVMLVNLENAPKISIGTMFEIAWAEDRGIPIVCVLPEDNVHVHAFVLESIGFRITTLEEALNIVVSILKE